MNVGDCVYLRLEGFNPSWRQAVVVAGKKNGSLRLGVRVTANEADTKAGLLTSFSVGGETFILVEGSLDRLRPACTQAHRSLEVDHALVLSSALETLKDDNIQYATASEDLSDAGGTMFPKPPAHRQKLVSSDSEEEESEESDADHVLKMLKRASKSETGMVTGKDKSKKGLSKTKSRYPLLARTGEKAKNLSAASDPLAWMMQSASSAEPVVDPMQMNALIQMELLKELRGRKAKSKTMLEDRSEDSDSSLETSSGGDEKLKGAGKALRAYRKNKRRMRRQPEKHIRRYIKEVEEVLGVGPRGGIHAHGLHQAAVLGKESYTTSPALCPERCSPDSAERKAEFGGIADHSTVAGHPSGQFGRWKLADSMVAVRSARPSGQTPFRGRSAAARSGRKLREGHERFGKEEQDLQSLRGRHRQQYESKRKRKDQRQKSQGRRQARELSSEACSPCRLSCKDVGGLFAIINKSHGSFARYWKIHTRAPVDGAGPSAPSHQTGHFTLFPSRLPWLTPPGKSRNRRGPHSIARWEAYQWMHRIWALFNFLDAGSPSRSQAMQQSVIDASTREWTIQHENLCQNSVCNRA